VKLALHRSIVFWSGLLAMGFVCWLWWASYAARPVSLQLATFRVLLGGDRFAMEHDGETIFVCWFWEILLAVAALWLLLLFLRARRRSKTVITR
jgi:hypothetical protein